MKKSIVLVLGILFAVISVCATLFVMKVPALIVIIATSSPISLAAFIYVWCAGTKDGDIPFVGY
ncbi:MAG TPA: hypothetical protein O0W81_01430 [Methanocorpusculum sp.]|nr:hypothetical protein [Methanocorpusculum sp.]HJJ90426.1 hypothetical protein [Methanocorpusculum sp.]